jgi:hypothetical protein
MFYELIKKGKFPKQVPLGARAVGWHDYKVDEWIRIRVSARNQLERPGQTVTDGPETLPPSRPPRRGARKETASKSAQSKRSAAPAPPHSAPPSTVRTAAAGRRPTVGINIDDDEVEAMNESEELSLLRKENAQLKKLVGELVLKNSLLQSSAGLKASNL